MDPLPPPVTGFRLLCWAKGTGVSRRCHLSQGTQLSALETNIAARQFLRCVLVLLIERVCPGPFFQVYRLCRARGLCEQYTAEQL